MATRTFDLTVARAAGGIDPVVVTARKLVLKRAESAVTLIIERDNNDRISIAAGETRTLTADDCEPIGPVHVENEAGTGELELYWSSMICMSAESGKADAAGGAAGLTQLYHMQANDGAITTVPFNLHGWSSDPISGTTQGAGTHAQGIHPPTGRRGWYSRATGALALTGMTQRMYLGRLALRSTTPGYGHYRYSREMYFDGTDLAPGGAGFLIEANGSGGIAETAEVIGTHGLGFVCRSSDFGWRAVYRDDTLALLIDEPLGVDSRTVRVLELRVGADEDGEPVQQWWIGGVMLYEWRGLLAGVFPATATHSNSCIAGVNCRVNVAGDVECILGAERGIRLDHSSEAL